MTKPEKNLPAAKKIEYLCKCTSKKLVPGLTARLTGGCTATSILAVFLCPFRGVVASSIMALLQGFGQAVWEAFGPAGSGDRSVNPHGLPFLRLTAQGWKHQPFRRSCIMIAEKLLREARKNRIPIHPTTQPTTAIIQTEAALTLTLCELASLLPKDKTKNIWVVARAVALSIHALSDIENIQRANDWKLKQLSVREVA